MRAIHRTSAKALSAPAILLIEEYDALGAAISSALKKFAPHHSTQLAYSLAEAEILAGKNRPELFIIDFYPSYPGLTAFLQKMQKTCPEARVLVIAAGVSPEITADVRWFGALQFIGKPYNVAEFGAAIQALLGPRRAAEPAGSLGTLGSLSLADIVALQCVGGRSAIIDAKETGGDSGEVHIVDGQISHAETDRETGVKALEAMFEWPSPRMRETAKRISKMRTIHGSWTIVFLDAWRKTRPAEVPPQEARPKTGKKIVIVDDTEMLVVFVEDVLSTADAELQLTTAITGIDGVKQVETLLPDLVLLDYSLPDINGDEVCRRLLENEQTAQIPVLMMSGHVAEMNAAAARFENIVATIEKPFLSVALVDLVQRTLAAGPRPTQPAKVISPPPATPVQSVSKPQELPREIQAAPKTAASPVPAPPVEAVPQPTIPQPVPIISAPLRSTGETEVVLGLFVEVLSMQLTSQLRMGTIRARPASSAVSLHFLAAAARDAIPETGFQLSTTEVDDRGQLSTLRLIPTTTPFHLRKCEMPSRSAEWHLFQANAAARVQLTPAGTTPMTMELFARLELDGVALSSTFQVAHLTLKWCTSAVRVTLDPKAPEQSGAEFECCR